MTNYDLGEQYMEFLLVYGVLFLQIVCRFEFFPNERLTKKQRGGRGWRGRGGEGGD